MRAGLFSIVKNCGWLHCALRPSPIFFSMTRRSCDTRAIAALCASGRRTALIVLLLLSSARSSTVDTLRFYSGTVRSYIDCIVVLPDRYRDPALSAVRYPAVYLLHCAGCTHLTWLEPGPSGSDVGGLVDSVSLIAVAPYNGPGYSWWLDSPLRQQSQFSSLIVNELKPMIDTLYRTMADRGATGITGHSMGGFGALHNAIEHPESFAAAAGVKSALDLRLPLNPDWPADFGLYGLLGSDTASAAAWQRVNVLTNARRFLEHPCRIRIVNGRLDPWFSAENAALHDTLTALGIPHDYLPVEENHYYVRRAVMRGILDFFDTVLVRQTGTVAPRRRTVREFQRSGGDRGGGVRHRLLHLQGRQTAGRSRACGLFFRIEEGEYLVPGFTFEERVSGFGGIEQ